MKIYVKLYYEAHVRPDFYKKIVNSEIERKFFSDEGLLITFSPFGPVIGKINSYEFKDDYVLMEAEIEECFSEFFKNDWVAGYGEGEEDENGSLKEFKLYNLFIGPCKQVEKIWKLEEEFDGE